jgi:hypothetical protein
MHTTAPSRTCGFHQANRLPQCFLPIRDKIWSQLKGSLSGEYVEFEKGKPHAKQELKRKLSTAICIVLLYS